MAMEIKNVLKVEDPCGPIFYLGTITPKEIKHLTFVPLVTTEERDSKMEFLNEEGGGYQRAGDSKRMEQIKRFVKERPSCLIPPVVLSARGNWEFKPSKTSEKFGVLFAKNVAAIIDGQHRLGGLLRLLNDDDVEDALKNRTIPFLAISDLDLDEEKQEFTDINSTQKGVKKSLIHYLDKEKEFSGVGATVLMEDEESPFKGRIDIEKKHDWALFLFGAAKECVSEMFGKKMRVSQGFDPFKDESLREPALVMVLEYWKAIKDTFVDQWADMELMPSIKEKKTKEKPGSRKFESRLLEETGIRAFSRLADDLFNKTYIPQMKAISGENLRQYLAEISKNTKVKKALTKPGKDNSVIQFDPKLSSSGKAGVEAIYLHLNSALDTIKI